MQVAADKESVEKIKAAKATAIIAAKEESIKKVAMFEDEQASTQGREDQNAARPPLGRITKNLAHHTDPEPAAISTNPRYVSPRNYKWQGPDFIYHLDPEQESQSIIFMERRLEEDMEYHVEGDDSGKQCSLEIATE
jgi:hypothetical protein